MLWTLRHACWLLSAVRVKKAVQLNVFGVKRYLWQGKHPENRKNSCHHFEAMSATIESVDNPLYNKWLDTRTFVNLMLTGRQICNVRPGPGARHFDMLDQLYPGIYPWSTLTMLLKYFDMEHASW